MFADAIKGEIVAALAASSANSLPAIPIWLGTQRSFIFGKLLIIRLRILEIRYVEFSMFFIPSTTDRESVQMHVFPLVFRLISIASRIAVASAAYTEEYSGSTPSLIVELSVVIA